MVDFTVAPDLEERTPTVPPELAKLLKTEKKLARWYEGLSEPIRWEIAKWIDAVKSAEARQRRLAEAAVRSERQAKEAEAEERGRAEEARRKAAREAAIAEAKLRNFLKRDSDFSIKKQGE